MRVSKFKEVLAHPLSRGMLLGATTWPTACLFQQYISGEETYDWKRCGRYLFYGTFITAPMFYSWIKFTSAIWPQTNFVVAIKKVILEQVTYGPIAGVTFFYGMTYLETGNPDKCVQEVREKFWPTFKTALCVWPIIQTINFACLSEKNRVIFASICSFAWTIFLAYIKQTHKEQQEQQQNDNEKEHLLMTKEKLKLIDKSNYDKKHLIEAK